MGLDLPQVSSICCKWSSSKRELLGGADKIVVIWKSTGQGLLKYNHTASIQCVKYSPTALQLASCSEVIHTQYPIPLHKSPSPPPLNAQVDIGMWTPDQKQVVKEKVHSKILCAAWSADGTLIAVGMINGWISIRNAASDELHHIERRAPIWCLQFVPGSPPAPTAQGKAAGGGSPSGGASQDSDLLVVGCWDKTLSLYR